MSCEHTSKITKNIKPKSNVCRECTTSGDSWVALRMCMTCGNVACCDSSKGHARTHFKDTGHPMLKPADSDDWKWCYPDNKYVD